MELLDIFYDNNDELTVTFKTDKDFRFLYCKATGLIKRGSEGNGSANYLFGKLCMYYFQTSCVVLILDFSELSYEFGDALQKSINFFREIGRDQEEKEKPIVLIKPMESEGINSLIDWIKPVKLLTVRNVDEANKLSIKLFDDYVND